MYEKALILHSILRWFALAAVTHAFLRGIRGWFGARSRGAPDRIAELVATIAVDVQLLVGFLLYFVWSPVTKNALGDLGAAMKDGEMRFFAVEHASMMFLAVALVHVSKIVARKGTTDVAKHRRAAIGFGIALALMIAGTPWPGSKVARPWLRT